MSECANASRGLNDSELASLGGFTSRMTRALAHLREAWLSADESNGGAIERALWVMFQGQSFQRNRELMLKVLTHGLDSTQAGQITSSLREPSP